MGEIILFIKAKEDEIEKKSNAKGTTKYQILRGYLFITSITILVVAVLFLFQAMIYSRYKIVSESSTQETVAKDMLSSHYNWILQLMDSMHSGADFEGNLNPETCSFGTWLSQNEHNITDTEIVSRIQAIKGVHSEVHSFASDINQLSEEQRKAKYDEFIQVYEPKISILIENLTAFAQRDRKSVV